MSTRPRHINGSTVTDIRRLQPDAAADIVDCFRRVYGESYANELFYDAQRLGAHMREGRIGCVGAVDDRGRLIAHMAMTIRPGARTVELGNTVVDPGARGQGLAWQVGASLTAWSVELGYRGYLHYPTADHHIMQRQSVKRGFETGLMLGYIPVETDGQVAVRNVTGSGRQAATIVYEPLAGESLADAPSGRQPETLYLPSHASDLVRQFARATGLERTWLGPAATAATPRTSDAQADRFPKRGLVRMRVERAGDDLPGRLRELEATAAPCRQIDFGMGDPNIEFGVETARTLGYWFCGWLPGHGATDIFRLQNVDRAQTNLSPSLVNPVAQSLLAIVPLPAVSGTG
jgi:GNAT superfamily N-acetyltransferase